ncbi:LysR family transcriptional regulator substrate-binding protein [Streptomyces sp. NPDC051218]|uniref:LysR family transcriptional regulator substrate-binding protein n=1 Tax=Streptomyces sp. NPDC051218 TaxID=3365645 RepID=UPI0037B35900
MPTEPSGAHGPRGRSQRSCPPGGHPALWPRDAQTELACTDDNFDAWLEAVAAGHGVGVAPEPVARRHSHPNLRYVRLKNAPQVPVHLAVPTHDTHPLAERYFRDLSSAKGRPDK